MMLRKIKTQKDISRIKRRNNIIVGVVMIGILTLSTLGYSLISSDNDKEDSNVNEFGVDFFKRDGLWKTVIGEGVFGFQNLPSEVSDIEVNVSFDLGMYSGQPLYFVNPNEGTPEILNNIGRYAERYQEACLVNRSCEGDLPVKNCRSNLIIFGEGNVTKVYQNESCIYIIGNSVKGADAFLYKLLGVN